MISYPGGNQVTSYMWYKFKKNSTVYGNIAANAKSNQRGEGEEYCIRVRCAEAETEEGGEEAGELEGPFSAYSL